MFNFLAIFLILVINSGKLRFIVIIILYYAYVFIYDAEKNERKKFYLTKV